MLITSTIFTFTALAPELFLDEWQTTVALDQYDVLVVRFAGYGF